MSVIYHAHAAPRTESEIRAAIDVYVTEQMRRLKIPGIAISIVEGDQIAYIRGYGVADAIGRPVTPQTPFLVASLSKSFTALGVMQLAEEGKLNLDAPVQRYLPWFQVADAGASSQITIRHLLYQTSGFSQIGGYEKNLDTNVADDALETSVRRLSRMRLSHPPGEAYEYTNTNYDILGLLIQTVSGQSYETYVRENIFAPLDMQHSFTSLTDARAGGVSSGYYPFFGIPMVYDNLMPYARASVPSAGLFFSAEDLAHYMIAHLNQGRYKNKAVVSTTGMAELHNPGAQVGRGRSYAMGWEVYPFLDAITEDKTSDIPSYTIPTAIYHGGSWANFNASMVLVPQKQVGVVVLMNTDDPTMRSAFSILGPDVALIHMGMKPTYTPRNQDFIRQNARLILAGIVVFLIIGCVRSVRNLRSRRQQYGARARPWGQIFGYIVLPAVIDIALALYLLMVRLPQDDITLLFALRFLPDIGLMYVVILVFTVGWGTVRTLLTLQQLLTKAETAAANP